MSRKIFLCIGLALVVVGSLLAGSASATAIAINNSSFQIPAMDDGGDSGTSTPYWNKDLSNTAYISIANVTDGSFPGTSGSPGLISGGDSTQLVYNYMGSPGGFGGRIFAGTQNGDTLQAGTYTLKVAVGNDQNWTGGEAYLDLGTYNGASGDGNGYMSEKHVLAASIPGGSMTTFQTQLIVSGSDPQIGNPILISLHAVNNKGSGAAVVCFDNVRLDYVPEPGTMALVASGLLGLLCYAWRKRR